MKIELQYFTGTGNSLKVMNVCKQVFIENNDTVEISAINKHNTEIGNIDLLGFCFPVYAFGIPRIANNYLNKLKPFKKLQKVFTLISAGDADEAGLSINQLEKILIKKNCEIIYSEVIQMPANWTPYINPPSKDEVLVNIEQATIHAKQITTNILNGVKNYHKFNIPKRFSKFGFYKEYWSFKYLGIKNMWRMFRTYDSCNGCQLCSKICPTQSIKIVDKKPKWSSSCEQCMRCVNFCPSEAIYQTYGGDTKGKNRYFEPSFKPLKENKNG